MDGIHFRDNRDILIDTYYEVGREEEVRYIIAIGIILFCVTSFIIFIEYAEIINQEALECVRRFHVKYKPVVQDIPEWYGEHEAFEAQTKMWERFEKARKSSMVLDKT